MRQDDTNEFEYYVADDKYTLIPDGEYWAICTDYKEQDYFIKGQGKKRKLYMCFDIYAEANSLDDMSEKIWMIFNMPKNRHFGKRSKYYQTWKMVWGRTPTRNARISPKIFLNRHFKIKTKTVKKYYDGEIRPEGERYSIIDEILMALPKT